MSELEWITADCATQVKGKTYPLSRFLAADIDFSQGWYLATIYLSPRNYHRYHYPVSGRVSGCFHGGNRLFPVNAFSCARVKQLYIKNERLITRIDLPGGSMYVVAVGATFVGSIVMTYLARRPARERRVARTRYPGGADGRDGALQHGLDHHHGRCRRLWWNRRLPKKESRSASANRCSK